MRRGPNPLHLVDPERDPLRALCLRTIAKTRRVSLNAPAASGFLGDVNPCGGCAAALPEKYPHRFAELCDEAAR